MQNLVCRNSDIYHSSDFAIRLFLRWREGGCENGTAKKTFKVSQKA